MIIDVANTIGKHLYKPEIKASDLIEQMDSAGVDIAVVHAYAEAVDNESVEQAIRLFPTRLIGLYVLNPWHAPTEEEVIEAILKRGFRGLYLDPIRHGYALCEKSAFYSWLGLAEKMQIPVMCYGAAEVFSSPIFFGDMAQSFPKLNIIMERMGLQYDNASAIQVIKKHSNLYTETSSSMDFNAIRTIKTAGADKVMMGSGTPYAGVFEMEIAKVKNATKDIEGGESKVLYQTAAKLFSLEGGTTF